MVPTRMLKGPASSCTPQNAWQDLASLAKTDRSSNFPFMTLVNSMAANLIFTDMAKSSMEKIMEGAVSMYTLADEGPREWFGGFLFSAGHEVNEDVQDQLSALSFSSWAYDQPFSLYAKCSTADPRLHSGALLLGWGVYTFLDRLFPVTMAK